ncbi:hypothetical protein SKAU_G00387610 [Synaphobranchus kaupii]|uniref:Uncharacterized protein n=1 Tax=Synaphobranchus kaupii TaxID=118154 RepID=A0A9Q1EAV1_SYNKA|nr:hypothetical protein SKAU_G00387610 [Synaphobranchus kaupii]
MRPARRTLDPSITGVKEEGLTFTTQIGRPLQVAPRTSRSNKCWPEREQAVKPSEVPISSPQRADTEVSFLSQGAGAGRHGPPRLPVSCPGLGGRLTSTRACLI